MESSDDEIEEEKGSDISSFLTNKENRSPTRRNTKLTESEKRRAESFLAWSPKVDKSTPQSELNDSELSLEPTPRSAHRKSRVSNFKMCMEKKQNPKLGGGRDSQHHI